MTDYWGWHYVVDLARCDIKSITSPHNISDFVKDLVDKIDMKAYGLPIIEHFAGHDPEKAGYSMVQLIETSNISGHFVDKNGSAFIDIFSCKPFDTDIVKKVIRKYFKPMNLTDHLMMRRAPDEGVQSKYEEHVYE